MLLLHLGVHYHALQFPSLKYISFGGKRNVNAFSPKTKRLQKYCLRVVCHKTKLIIYIAIVKTKKSRFSFSFFQHFFQSTVICILHTPSKSSFAVIAKINLQACHEYFHPHTMLKSLFDEMQALAASWF